VGRRSVAARRLAEHAVPVTVSEAKKLDRVHVLKEQNLSSFGFVNSLLNRFKPAKTAKGELTRANAWLTVSQYLLLRCLVAAILYFVPRALVGVPLLAIASIPIGLMIPRVGLLVLARRRLKAFEAQ